jgi:Flp pilus assembly protein TadB
MGPDKKNIPERMIDELAKEKLDGTSYADIRARLKAEGMQEEEIASLIRKVDEKVLEVTTSQGNITSTRQWYRAGLIIAVAGLALAITFNAGLIFRDRSALLVYTPFICGILIMFYSRMQQRRISKNSNNSPGPIRKRRPFK